MTPIDLLLFCPECGAQHVDAPEPATGWTNPPHRSHLCHTCGAVWRPADVPTNGVEAIGTIGDDDTVGPIAIELPIVSLLKARVRELEPIAALINRPETEDFLRGVQLEAGHQRWRWGRDHDATKDPDLWFWTLGHLAGKARHHHTEGNAEKARHHLISSAALLSHWHEHVSATEATVAAPPTEPTPPPSHPGCSGVSASWCPIHGDCTCPKDEEGCPIEENVGTASEVVHDPECPLHGEESDHAEVETFEPPPMKIRDNGDTTYGIPEWVNHKWPDPKRVALSDRCLRCGVSLANYVINPFVPCEDDHV